MHGGCDRRPLRPLGARDRAEPGRRHRHRRWRAEARELGTSRRAGQRCRRHGSKTAVPTVDALLNGRAPGVAVLPGTGMVGAGAKVRIRGIGSFSPQRRSAHLRRRRPRRQPDGHRHRRSRRSARASSRASTTSIPTRSRASRCSRDRRPRRSTAPRRRAASSTSSRRRARRARRSTTFMGRAAPTGSRMPQVASPPTGVTSRAPTSCTTQRHRTALGLNNVQRAGLARHADLPHRRRHDYSANVSGGVDRLPLLRQRRAERRSGRRPDQRRSARAASAPTSDHAEREGRHRDELRLRQQPHDARAAKPAAAALMWDSEYSNPANLPQFCAARRHPAAPGCAASTARRRTPIAVQQDWQDLNRLTASATLTYNPFTWFSNRVRRRHGLHPGRRRRVRAVPHERHARLLLGRVRQGISLQQPAPGDLQHLRLQRLGALHPAAELEHRRPRSACSTTPTRTRTSPARATTSRRRARRRSGPPEPSSRRSTTGPRTTRSASTASRSSPSPTVCSSPARRASTTTARSAARCTGSRIPRRALRTWSAKSRRCKQHIPSWLNSLRLRARVRRLGTAAGAQHGAPHARAGGGPERRRHADAEHLRQSRPEAGARARHGARLRVRLVQRPLRHRLHVLPRRLEGRDPVARRRAVARASARRASSSTPARSRSTASRPSSRRRS